MEDKEKKECYLLLTDISEYIPEIHLSLFDVRERIEEIVETLAFKLRTGSDFDDVFRVFEITKEIPVEVKIERPVNISISFPEQRIWKLYSSKKK